ncbi:MAG TPA: SEC-C domain-containing protein [Aliidongia sp.]|nr:SEC-C domain-containing protein [Aliidongia sp.]
MIKYRTAIALASKVEAYRYKPSKRFWRAVGKTAEAMKTTTANTDEKNRLWFVQTFAQATTIYLDAYQQMSGGKFMDGWCTLEQAELSFGRLLDNVFIESLVPLIGQRAELVALWQSLFPYKHFVSPGMRFKKWACSICGKQSTPIDPCGHIRNRVYDGQLCYRIIQEFEPLEVSIVTDPVQKYSVLQLDYDYPVVQYVLDHLSGPFQPWRGEWTHKRHPHSKFADRSHDQPCPCRSGLRYRECCLPTDGVRLPHFQMTVTDGPCIGPLGDLLVTYPPDKRQTAEYPRTCRVNLLRAGDNR